MAGDFDKTVVRHTDVGPAGTISYLSTGWSLFLMFHPRDDTLQNISAYLWSNDTPFQGRAAVNIYINGAGSGLFVQGTVHCRVESTVSAKLDSDTTSSYIPDQWNAIALTWDGTNFHIFMNGAEQIIAPLDSVGTITPTKVGVIGVREDLNSARTYFGRICHVAQFNRSFTSSEGQRYTGIFVSPAFVQQDKVWHLPIWNADFNFDQQGIKTVTPTNMLFGPHAPASYPCMTATNLDEEDPTPTQSRRVLYVGA
jgi:hypothetical protein